MSDLDGLLARVQSGDTGAHRELMSELYVTLRRRFRSRGSPTPSELDDLVQATLLVLVRKLGSRFDSFRPVHPGAFTVFVLKVADLVQRGQQTAFARAAARRADQSREALDPGPSPSKWVADRELLAKVERLIVELGSADQRSVQARIEDESWRAQVEREGVQRASLRARLSRALARIRARARDAGLVPASSSG